MGIAHNSKMVVGELVENIDTSIIGGKDNEDIFDWAEDNDMVYMFPYFDAPTSECLIGYEVDDIAVGKIDYVWLHGVQMLGAKFESLTGASANLIGAIDVC